MTIGKWSRIISTVFTGIVLIIVFYALLGELYLPGEKTDVRNICETYTEGWVQVLQDGTTQAVDLPGNLVNEGTFGAKISHVLPDVIGDDMYLIFRASKQDMEIYVGDELRTAYSTEFSRIFGKVSPTFYVFVKLHPEDAGKMITADYYTEIDKYVGLVSEIFYANYNGFLKYMIAEQGTIFLIAIIMIVIGILALVISVALLIIYRRRQKLTSVSMGVLVVSVWIICNSIFRQFLFPNVAVVGELAFLMVALLPCPFAVYINQIQKNRYEKVYYSIEAIALLDTILSTIAYLTGHKDFSETFYCMAAVILIFLVTVFVTMVLDAKRGYIKNYLVTAIALGVDGIVMLAQVAIYLQTDKTFDISLAAIGLMILLAIALFDTFKDIDMIKKEKESAVLENTAKSQFLANMSHEIRTPINAVLGMNTMILRESKDENIRKYANDIQSAGKSLLSVINDILDFSKIESGKMTLTYADYEFAAMMNDVVNMIKPKAEDRSLAFELLVDETIPSVYIGDDVRIKQILINLLTNAVKYTPEGTVTLTVTGKGRDEDGSALLHFSVKDTGIGIKPEDISKLTEEFVRIEESRNRKIEGTGLGINISGSLLHLMGSKLEVQSVYGEGSDFSFTLKQMVLNANPIGNIWEKMQQEVVEEEYVVDFCIPDGKLLVVDDNDMNRSVFKNLLKEMNCQIDDVDCGEKCLEMVQKTKYDIIFMDHMMPGMDGIETFRQMKEMGDYLNADTPVVILTANAISGARGGYMAEGFREYLTKPIDGKQLEKTIGKLMPKKKKKPSVKSEPLTVEKPALEEFPVIDGVDWQSAYAKLEDVGYLKQASEIFVAMAENDLETLLEMYGKLSEEGADFSELRIKVHSMKSNAATIGANHVAGLAKYIEYAAKENDLNTIQALMPVFSREWTKLREAVAQGLGIPISTGENQTLGETLSKEELLEYLDMLAEAMETMDIDRADAVMEELAEHPYESTQRELLEQLKPQVMNMDPEASGAIIDEWKKQLG